jgi:hypothetical protein
MSSNPAGAGGVGGFLVDELFGFTRCEKNQWVKGFSNNLQIISTT